jgi:hypothetical protein
MTAYRDDATGTGAIVRKPARKERAGSEVRTLRRALWRFNRGDEGGRKILERSDWVIALVGRAGRVSLSTHDDGFRG